MVTWTLSDIRSKVRNITGRKSTTQLSNNDLDDYINNFYQFVLPNEIHLKALTGWYVTNTVVGDDTISIAEANRILKPPTTINGSAILLYHDPNTFFDKFKRPDHHSTGTTTATTASKLVNANAEFIKDGVAVDDFVKNVTDGTTTTVSAVDSKTQLSLNADIFTSGQLYEVTISTGEPTAVLANARALIFRPVPDKVYEFRAALLQVPSALSASTDKPTEENWGPLIAYGAAIDIHMDNGERDAAAKLGDMYRFHRNLVMRPQLVEKSYSRAIARF